MGSDKNMLRTDESGQHNYLPPLRPICESPISQTHTVFICEIRRETCYQQMIYSSCIGSTIRSEYIVERFTIRSLVLLAEPSIRNLVPRTSVYTMSPVNGIGPSEPKHKCLERTILVTPFVKSQPLGLHRHLKGAPNDRKHFRSWWQRESSARWLPGIQASYGA